jgi:hypothetical protein
MYEIFIILHSQLVFLISVWDVYCRGLQMPMVGVKSGGDKIRRQQKMVDRAPFSSFYDPTLCNSQMGDLVVKEPPGQRVVHSLLGPLQKFSV